MSGTKGFPSNKKTDLGTGITENFVTVVPTDPNRNSLDVNRFAFRVDDPLNPRTAGAGTGLINDGSRDLFYVEDTSTPARVGDIVRFENGNAAFIEIPIVKVETNRFLLSVNSGFLPSPGDAFFILRHTTQRVDETGSQIVIAQQGPTQFVLDGLDVEVEEDTANVANNKPLPTKVFDSTNNPINPASIESVQDVETAVIAVETTIQGIDFATQTTLASLEAKVLTDTQLRASAVPVSASSLPLPTGAATQATLLSIDTKTPSLVGGSVPVTGPLTDTQLRATAVPVSAASLPLPSGAATAANQATGNGLLNSIDAGVSALINKIPAVGKTTMSGSLPVTLASDQTPILVSGPKNPNASTVTNTSISTTPTTISAPAFATGFKIYAMDTNSTNLRIALGTSVSTTTGMQLQPGRSEDFSIATNISICSEAGSSQSVVVIWALSQ